MRRGRIAEVLLARFGGGVHPAGCKQYSREKEIGRLPDPKEVWVPLSQHIGAPAVPAVQAGERVLRGQLIGRAAEGLSANVFSPVAGTVKGIVTHITFAGKKTEHVLIENDFSDEHTALAPLAERTPESVLARIAEAGIVGMGGAGFPTAVKLNVRGRVDTLLINGAECEPYITCDDRLMREYAAEVTAGAELCRLACGAQRVIIGVEKNKPEAIVALTPFCKENISLKKLRTRYPQGAEKQFIRSCTGRTVGEGELPADAGVVVINAHTAYAVWAACEKGEPCYERVMTVSGGAVERPANLWVKNGTPLREIADHCGAHEECGRIVSGGPMMGDAVFSLKICAKKTTSALLFLSKEEAETNKSSVCIGCGKCVQACPMGLSPTFIEEALLAKNYAEAKRYGASACIGCGCCSYVCPAKRYLAQGVKLAKKIISERGI